MTLSCQSWCPFRDARACVKMGAGCPSTPILPWVQSPHVSLAPGPELEGCALLLRARRSDSGSPSRPRAARRWPPRMRGASPMDSTDTLVEVDSTDAEIVARVAAIDVAKDSGMVCARVPHQ